MITIAGALGGISTTSAADPITDLPPGQWYEVPNSTMRQVVPSPLAKEIYAAEGPVAIIGSWSGGAFDSHRERLLVWGGGHTAYGGNEVYAFDTHTLTWSRLSNPSSMEGFDENATTMPDGRPKAVHSYDHLEYVPPPYDKFFAVGGSVFPQGSMMRTTWYFDFTTNDWERLDDVPGSYNYEILAFNMLTAWDPVTSKVLVQGGYKNGDFDPQAKAWTIHPGDMRPRAQPLGMTGALDPERRKFVAIGRGHAYITAIDENGNLGVPQPIQTTGANTIEAVDAPGFAYDPVTKQMVAWGGGADIYTLNLDTLVWTKVAGSGAVAPPDPYVRTNYHGTFGRFRYVPSKNAFVVVSGIDENVFFYKLSSGSGNIGDPNAPAVSLAADSLVIAPQGTATLSWSSRNVTNCTASGAWSGDKGTSGVESVGPLSETSIFNLSCSGTAGSVDASVQIKVDSSTGGEPITAPTATLTASPQEVAAGGSAVLKWSTTDAESCEASGGWTGTRPAAGTEPVGPLEQNTAYTLACSGPGGNTSETVTINVGAVAGPPQVTLEADQTDSTVVLTWASSNSESCEASNGWSGAKNTFGQESLPLQGQQQTYTLTCTGTEGSSSKSVTVGTQPKNPGNTDNPGSGSKSKGGGGAITLPALLAMFLYGLFRRRSVAS